MNDGQSAFAGPMTTQQALQQATTLIESGENKEDVQAEEPQEAQDRLRGPKRPPGRPKRPQDHPKRLQEKPQVALRCPRTAPRSPPKGPKRLKKMFLFDN